MKERTRRERLGLREGREKGDGGRESIKDREKD